MTALMGCGGDAGPRYDISAPRVALAWIKNVEHGAFIAEQLKYYETGLTPNFLPGGPNAPMPR